MVSYLGPVRSRSWVRYGTALNYDSAHLNFEEKYCRNLRTVFSGVQRYGTEIWCYNKPYRGLFSGLLKVSERLALWKPKITQSLSFTALTKITLLYRKIQLIATNLTLFELFA